MNILLTGGTGFIGKALTQQLLNQGHTVTLLCQKEIPKTPGLSYLISPDASLLLPLKQITAFDAIINLAGYNIGKDFFWNRTIKRKILESRIQRTKQIVTSLLAAKKQGLAIPALLINASAIGYYGINPGGIITEDSPSGSGFLAKVCRRWEESVEQAAEANVTVIRLRFGIVLGKGGGVLKKMTVPFSFGMGGILGNGDNWVSWIHRDDLIASILFALSGQLAGGPYNVTAPNPVSMQDFGKALGEVLHKKCWTKMPPAVAHLIFGEMADEILLCSQRAIPQGLTSQNFTFHYPTLREALQQIYNPKKHHNTK